MSVDSGTMNGGDPCGGIYKYAEAIYKCQGSGQAMRRSILTM